MVLDMENEYSNEEEEESCEFIDYPSPPRPPGPPMPVQIRIEKRFAFMRRPFFMPHSNSYDSTKAFKDGRVIYLSDFKVSRECTKRYPIFYGTIYLLKYFRIREYNYILLISIAMPRSGFLGRNSPIEMMSAAAEPPRKSALADFKKEEPMTNDAIDISTVRQYFPETWLWNIEITE
jgi:hypothetical protein